MEQFLGELSESQRQAVVYNDGPSLVIAGAGAGKTRVLTYKIAYLLKNEISPYNILALTFTNKAAREMKERIGQILGEDIARKLWMGTFHSIFSRILRREAEKLGFNSDFTIYDNQDSKNLIKSIVKELALDDKVYKPSVILARISRMKNALITPELYEIDRELIEDDFRSKRPMTRDIYTIYRNRCRTSSVMDFDDLLFYTWLLFHDFPEVALKYRDQFQFILVDEYQDTNSVQHEIINQLAADHHRVCVVGDDAQSIYSFRGANIDNILDFRKIYPESKLFKLEQNYRSTQMIVNAANSLIGKNKEQIRKTVFSQKQAGETIRVIGAYSDHEEGHSVAGRIAEMRLMKQYKYSDFAILYRTNAQSRIFEEALRKRNLPYRIYGGLSFFQRKEVKDVVAYFRLICNPNDEEALKRIINYPARGIGDTTLGKIAVCANNHQVSFWDVLTDPTTYDFSINYGMGNRLQNFINLITSFIEANETLDAYELGELVLREAGLIRELYHDKTPEGLSRKQNTEELVNSLHRFVTNRREQGSNYIKLSDFLSEISLMTDQDTSNKSTSDLITLMTIHAAKGLEFKNVFVVGLEEDLFPSQLSTGSERSIEEERRLFYVAITRAEENCVLSYAKTRFHYGQSRTSAPSRFLRDIDRQYLRLPFDAPFGNPAPKPSFQPDLSRKIPPAPVAAPTSTGGETHNSYNLLVGDTIEHERFGIGKVTALAGSNENAKATIVFRDSGAKQLLLRFAKFKILRK